MTSSASSAGDKPPSGKERKDDNLQRIGCHGENHGGSGVAGGNWFLLRRVLLSSLAYHAARAGAETVFQKINGRAVRVFPMGEYRKLFQPLVEGTSRAQLRPKLLIPA
jgi:hypothetical protein